MSSKIYFILLLGYFKFSNKFFKFHFHEVLEDVQYIIEKYFANNGITERKQAYNRKTIFNHQSIILPAYSTLQKLISKAIIAYEYGLFCNLKDLMDNYLREKKL